ncbi:LamG-like jellyroll fold domain-containing protein [Micromonospora sp. NPDC049523]|uniref:LamG-like jellyroll fold domain-containing protein n=1 Tax=Micromonospora sp. NPDC049523 TaxID=3155921 RepID=UPI003449E638
MDRRQIAISVVVGMAASLVVTVPATAAPEPTVTTEPATPTEATSSPPDPVRLALAEADRRRQPVEVPSLHTENSTTVANPGGKTLATTVHAYPVRFARDGGWRATDLTLVADGGSIRPKSAKDEVRLSAGGDTALLSVKTGTGEAKLSTPTPLPKPVLSGDTATYPAAYGPDVDLVVRVTPEGIRHRIVLHRRPAKSVAFGLTVAAAKGVRYRAGEVADDGVKVADLVPPLLLDAAADRSPVAGRTGEVTVGVNSQGTELTYTPSATFLNDPATAYPVVLAGDPTPWFGPGFPTDAFVATDSRFSTGRSTQFRQELLAGRNNFDGAVSTYYVYRSYLKFNLTGAPFFGRPILNADMRPWNYITTACGASAGNIAVRRVTSDWALNASSPVDLRWDNQPAVTTSGQTLLGTGVGRILKRNGSYQNCSQPAQELYYSIESIVQSWADGSPNYGLQVAANNDSSGGSNYREYLSSEWSGVDGRGPVLFVEYEAPEPNKVEPFFIPSRAEDPAPTVADMMAHRIGTDRAPTLPVLSEQEALALRQNAAAAIKQDSAYGLYPPADMSREEWLTDLDLPSGGWEPEPDTSPPVVVSTVPGTGAGDVPLDTPVTATFDEIVTGAALTVTDGAGAAVAGSVAEEGTTVTFTPAQPLTAGTTYSAQVSGAKDVDDNVMAAPHGWSFTTDESTPAPVGLVAAYGMDEGSGTTVGDRSGNANTGTATGLTWRAGKFGRALSFDGADESWVTIPDSPSLRLTDGMTISAWVRPTSVASWRTAVMKDGLYGSAYGLYASNGFTPSTWLLNGEEEEHTIVDGEQPLPVNTWSHLATTYDGSTVRLLVNGAEVASLPRTRDLVVDDGDLHIGGNGIWGEFFQGAIDEVRIYNRAQTVEQVQADMNAPVTPVTPVTRVAPAASAARAQAALADEHPYEHLEHEDCEKKLGGNGTFRYIPSSYSVCYTGKIGEIETNAQDTPTGPKWIAQISVVVHSFVGDLNGTARGLPSATSRQIKIYVRVSKYLPTLWPTSITRPVTFLANNSSSCNSDTPLGIQKSIGQWINAPDQTITLTSPQGTALPDYKAFCGIQPSLFYPESDGDRRHGWLDNTRLDFRCDSSTFYKGYKGGCVVWSVRPTWVLNGNEEKSEQTAEHIWGALYDPQTTTPLAPGKIKRIPGKINLSDLGCASATGCLTRTTSNRKTKGSVSYQNYQRAKKECKPLDKAGYTRPSCDEYPFASTHQGGASSGIHFSAAIVELSDNCSAGGKLNGWYRVNRILESDPFWVDVVKKGAPTPPDVTHSVVTPDDLAECLLV